MANDVLGNQFVNMGSVPAYTEATRLGNGWNTQMATPLAPLVAAPTTTAALTIYNNSNGSGSNILVIDELYAMETTGIITSTEGYGLWAQVSKPAAATVGTVTALSIYSSSGRAPYTGIAGSRVITTINTATATIANGWRPWGDSPIAWEAVQAAVPGYSWSVNIRGRLIVPPMCSLDLHIVGSVASTVRFIAGATWYELPLRNTP